MKYKIYHSQRFKKELTKFDKKFQDRVDKIEDELVENPYSGKPLGVKWFREKRYENYRIYYLIYDDLESVFMAGISDKKDQQKVINTIKLLLELFRKELESLIDKNKFT
ncbi:type II toxin-antitoxin system RelE/ParE family toxin [Candidatus Pacearchaeota archaeon]|nr:type II toxin-antitoxin system RelE/ParE family toxin [Candidatus Pacearchaeota archaeon]